MSDRDDIGLSLCRCLSLESIAVSENVSWVEREGGREGGCEGCSGMGGEGGRVKGRGAKEKIGDSVCIYMYMYINCVPASRRS